MMDAHDRFYIDHEHFKNTIDIDTLGVGTTEFSLSNDRKNDLYESGRKEAKKFLDKIESGASPAETLPTSPT
jgi:NTE family protein